MGSQTTQIRIDKSISARLGRLSELSRMTKEQIADAILGETLDAIEEEKFIAWPVPSVTWLRTRLKKPVPAAPDLERIMGAAAQYSDLIAKPIKNQAARKRAA